MYRIISIVIFLLLFFRDAQNSIAWGQLWLKPDKATQGRIYCDLDRQIKVVAGDTLSDKIQPYFTVEKWGNSDDPVWLRIRQCDTDPDSIRMQGNSICIFDGFQKQAIYPLGDGLEWIILLQQKPDSNVLAYPFFCSNLVFSYQGELTPDEIAHGARRPDSVVGSYAVYHKSRVHGEYETGKAFHIYRPKAWDIDGDTVRCDLDIDTEAETLSLTLPAGFWLNAAYPIVIDPHFGYDTMGASEIGVGSNWTYAALLASDHYAASTGDNVDSLYSAVRSPGASGYSMAMAIYSVISGNPNTKIMESDRFDVSNTIGWYGIAVDQALANGKAYCVAAGEFNGLGTWWFKYDSDTDAVSENGNSFPTSWSGTALDYRLSMYAVYTAAGGGGDVNPRRRKVISSLGVDR